MKNKPLILLLIAALGFGAGIYMKYIRTYSNEQMEVVSKNDRERYPRLGELIATLENIDAVVESYRVDSGENAAILKCLKTINHVSIILIASSVLIALRAINKLRSDKHKGESP